MSRLDVLAVGELNPDLILEGLSGPPRPGQETLASRCSFTLGSSTALCAANLAALGLRVGIVAKVGTDLFGSFVIDALSARGVDTSRVIRDASLRTGITVSLTSSADRAMVTYAGAMTALTAADIDPACLASARHLHVSSWFLQTGLQAGGAELFRAAKARGLTTSLDPAWDPGEQWESGIEGLYEWLDILFVNRLEAAALGRDPEWRTAAGRLARRVGLLVVKGGADGLSIAQGTDWQDYSGFPVEAIDPTGAGDACNAGFLAGRLAGRPLPECAAWGNACGAMTAARLGGSGAFGSAGEVEAFIRSKRRVGDRN